MDSLDFPQDVVAILLGISFTVAKLDAQGRKASGFPQVAPADFEHWRAWTVSIYRLGSSICFLRVLFHQAWSFYQARHPVAGPFAPLAMRYSGAAMDLLWLSVLAATFIRAARARARRRELGIVLSPLTPAQAAVLAPDNERDETKND